MTQEEHILRYSYSGGGGGVSSTNSSSGSRSKKVKQKKVPQRGLGVAQLEKIRIEEQQKREALQAANILASNAIGSPNDTTPCLGVQCQSLRTSLSPPPPPPPNVSSSDVFRPPPSISGSEISYKNAVHVPKQLHDGRGLVSGHGSWPRLNLEGENLQRFDYHVPACRAHVNLSYESNVPQRLPQFQHHSSSSSSSMVNSSSGISQSSLLSSHMEPPSNQNFRVNNYTPSRSEEDKMIGMKRPYPFSLESPPAPSFHRNFPTYAASRSRSDELVSCSIGDTAHMEARKKNTREGPSNSSTLSEPEHSPNEVIRDEGGLNGDFLTLAPPVASSPTLNLKHKHPLNYSEYQDSSQENQICHLGARGSVELPHSFFPVDMENDQPIPYIGNGNSNGEKSEAIDLNLKL